MGLQAAEAELKELQDTLGQDKVDQVSLLPVCLHLQ